MLLTQEQILAKIKSDLNALVIELGFVDDKGRPLYFFHGELSTYDSYDWIKSIETYGEDDELKYLPIIPFALIRTNSTTSAGETIKERLDEYDFSCLIRAGEKEDIREIFETYMARENITNNLVQIEDSNVLKNFSNFVIDDEQLPGAPDGNSRHQCILQFTYNIFESSLTSSKDYTLLIDDIPVKYVSWRFEKANMVVANSDNSPSGKVLTNLNKLHEITLVCELYLDKENISAMKVREDLFAMFKTNTSYKVQLQCDGEDLFNQNMVLNGGKTTDTPPQINAMEVTFALSYERAKIRIGISGEFTDPENPGQVFEDIPIATYKFGHAAALYTATFFGDNASKSQVVGLAKGIALTVPILMSGSIVMESLLSEVLGKVYTNKYAIEITYLNVTRYYIVVLTESAITSDDAAYDIVTLVFSEAK